MWNWIHSLLNCLFDSWLLLSKSYFLCHNLSNNHIVCFNTNICVVLNSLFGRFLYVRTLLLDSFLFLFSNSVLKLSGRFLQLILFLMENVVCLVKKFLSFGRSLLLVFILFLLGLVLLEKFVLRVNFDQFLFLKSNIVSWCFLFRINLIFLTLSNFDRTFKLHISCI